MLLGAGLQVLFVSILLFIKFVVVIVEKYSTHKKKPTQYGIAFLW